MTAEKFKDIYFPFYKKLYRIAFYLLNDGSLSADVVQETYCRIWSKKEELHTIKEPEAYAVVVLRNVCLKHIRDKKKTVELYDAHLVENNSLINKIELKDNANYMMELIAALPEQQRLIITMKDVEGYSYKEIEGVTGLSMENIRVILSRTRKKLREEFVKTEQR